MVKMDEKKNIKLKFKGQEIVMKKFWIPVIAAIISLGATVTAFATETKDTLKETATYFLEAHYGHTINLDDGIDLLGNSQNVIARCYQVDEGGYIIISTEDQQVVEFSITDNNPFFTDATKNYYYGGPLTIFYKGIMPSEKVLDFPVDCNTLTGSVNL